jgi:hypothetical protein
MRRLNRRLPLERYNYFVTTSLTELGVSALTAMYTLGSLAEERGSTSSIVVSGVISIATGLDAFRRTKVMEGIERNPYGNIIETTGYESSRSLQLPPQESS